MKQLTNLTALIMLLLILPGCGDRKSKSAEAADPWLWLEEVDAEKSLDWAREQNRLTDEVLTVRPEFTELRDRFLGVLNDKERIIYPNITGEMSYNLWQDEKNERGLWRRMSKKDYLAGKDVWRRFSIWICFRLKKGKSGSLAEPHGSGRKTVTVCSGSLTVARMRVISASLMQWRKSSSREDSPFLKAKAVQPG